MLKLKVVMGEELFDDKLNEFVERKEFILELEHSLIALSKWESKWEKPYMGTEKKTTEEVLGYIQCMCMTSDIPPEVFLNLTSEHFKEVNAYVDAKMSATWFNDRPTGPGRKEIITAEIIYYWMISLNIPFECENWHLNRLITLIKVCSSKNAPAKTNKMGKAEMLAERNRLNAKRKAEANSRG
jgi:hypothetical protein